MAATLNDPKRITARTGPPMTGTIGPAGMGATPTAPTAPAAPSLTPKNPAAPGVTAVKRQGPPMTGTIGPASMGATAAITEPKVSKPPTPFDSYGGKDSYISSQIDRFNNANGDKGLMNKLQADAKRVGYTLPNAPAGTGVPKGYEWLGAGFNNEVEEQLAAYNAQQEQAKIASDYQIGQNNQYLSDQIKAMQGQRAVDQDSLQQQQNRFGGLYSGGLNYQGGQINSAYATQQGQLSRDISDRNAQLTAQYGSQANEIAKNIAQLQASRPEIINEKIRTYLDQQAGLYGSNPLTGQSTLEGKKANLDASLAVGDQAGQILNPQNDWQGLMRQVQSGKAPTSLQGKQFESQEQQRSIDNAYRMQQSAIDQAYQAGQLTLAQAQEARMSLGQQLDEAYRWAGLDWDMMNSGSGAEAKSTFSPTQVYSAIQSKYSDFFNGEETPVASDLESMYQDVIKYGLDETQENDILRGIGLSDSQIAEFDKKYLSSGN